MASTVLPMSAEGEGSPRSKALASHASVVHLPHSWFVVCPSKALRKKPFATELQGLPLVLFRNAQGQPVAFLDRCPHRNVPLSQGRVEQGTLRCAYHGWRFDSAGTCVEVPGLKGEPEARSRCAQTYATREQEGFVWVYSTPGVSPTHEPYRFPLLDAPGYSTVRQILTAPSTVHAALENTLDVPHTAFLHGGLFRSARAPREIEVVVKRSATQAEAEFIGEPRPSGLVGKLLAPGGGEVQHFDRFLMPSIAQVEYRLGTGSHLIVTSAMTPLSDWETRIHAVVTFRLPLPAWLVKPFLTPVALYIFKQDARILAEQSRMLRRFGSESYASSEADVLGPPILQMLRKAAQGKIGGPVEGESAVMETRTRMRI